MASKASITLFQFTTALMRDLGLADNPTPVQAQILDYLETGPKRRVIAAFRGCGKSTLSAIYLLWRLYINPDEKCLIVSASMGRAEAMTAWMLKTISDISWLRHMMPNTHDGRYSRIQFDVGTCNFIEQSPSTRAAGVQGQITGSRASIILSDDIETPQTALTQMQREKLRNSINEYEAILKPGPNSEIVFLGTPHSSVESIYFTLRRTLNYDMRMWPARVPDNALPYMGCLAPLIHNQLNVRTLRPTDTRFTHEELEQRRLSMSPMQWRLQFMLDPTMSDIERYPLRCSDVMVMDIDSVLPEVIRYEKSDVTRIRQLPCCGMAHDTWWYRPADQHGSISASEVPTVMALDPSGGGADEFGWAIVKAWAGNYYLIESGGSKGGVSESLWVRLAKLAKKHNVNEIVIESNFGGLEIYQQVLKPYLIQYGAECRIEAMRSNQRKELRIIDTLAPLLQTHRVGFDRRVIEDDNRLMKEAQDDLAMSYSLVYQMTRLTQERGALLHDDRLDCFAMACQWFQEQAAQDQNTRMSYRTTELLEAMVEDSLGNTLLDVDRLAFGMTLEQARAAANATHYKMI